MTHVNEDGQEYIATYPVIITAWIVNLTGKYMQLQNFFDTHLKCGN